MRDRPFQTIEEIETYVGGESIECLECGRRFRILNALHLMGAHEMTQREYRERWGLPATLGLAASSLRAAQRATTTARWRAGELTGEHLAAASDPATRRPMTPKPPAVRAAHSAMVRALRPGDTHRLRPGARNPSGRDMDRAREYQRARRALLAGDPTLMDAYRTKYRC